MQSPPLAVTERGREYVYGTDPPSPRFGGVCGLRMAVGVSAAWMARKKDGLRFSQPKPVSTIDCQRQRFGVWQGSRNVLEESAL